MKEYWKKCDLLIFDGEWTKLWVRIGWDQGREADEKEKPVKKKLVVERVTRDLRRIMQFFNYSFPSWWRYMPFWLSRTEHHDCSVKFAYKHFHRVPDSKIDRDTAVIFNIEAGMRASLFSSRYNSSFLYVYRKSIGHHR